MLLNSTETGTSLTVLSSILGWVNKAARSLTEGEVPWLFALMNITGNFTQLNYSKKLSANSHCCFQLYKTLTGTSDNFSGSIRPQNHHLVAKCLWGDIDGFSASSQLTHCIAEQAIYTFLPFQLLVRLFCWTPNTACIWATAAKAAVSGRLVTSFHAAAANLGAAVFNLGYNTSSGLAHHRGRRKNCLFSTLVSKSNRQSLHITCAVLRQQNYLVMRLTKGR